MLLARKYDLHIQPSSEPDYGNIPAFPKLSIYVDNCVEYIAGNVVRSVQNHLKCEVCY